MQRFYRFEQNFTVTFLRLRGMGIRFSHSFGRSEMLLSAGGWECFVVKGDTYPTDETYPTEQKDGCFQGFRIVLALKCNYSN